MQVYQLSSEFTQALLSSSRLANKLYPSILKKEMDNSNSQLISVHEKI